jgi:hypothetical protein
VPAQRYGDLARFVSVDLGKEVLRLFGRVIKLCTIKAPPPANANV